MKLASTLMPIILAATNGFRVLTFDLTRADQITLTAGTAYGFELWNAGGAAGSSFFQRG